jgi:hypothetical protein
VVVALLFLKVHNCSFAHQTVESEMSKSENTQLWAAPLDQSIDSNTNVALLQPLFFAKNLEYRELLCVAVLWHVAQAQSVLLHGERNDQWSVMIAHLMDLMSSSKQITTVHSAPHKEAGCCKEGNKKALSTRLQSDLATMDCILVCVPSSFMLMSTRPLVDYSYS